MSDSVWDELYGDLEDYVPPASTKKEDTRTPKEKLLVEIEVHRKLLINPKAIITGYEMVKGKKRVYELDDDGNKIPKYKQCWWDRDKLTFQPKIGTKGLGPKKVGVDQAKADELLTAISSMVNAGKLDAMIDAIVAENEANYAKADLGRKRSKVKELLEKSESGEIKAPQRKRLEELIEEVGRPPYPDDE